MTPSLSILLSKGLKEFKILKNVDCKKRRMSDRVKIVKIEKPLDKQFVVDLVILTTKILQLTVWMCKDLPPLDPYPSKICS